MTSSKEQLTQLNGIGDKKAELIISYRDEHGKHFHVLMNHTMMGIYPSYYEVNGEKKQIIGTQFESTAAQQQATSQNTQAQASNNSNYNSSVSGSDAAAKAWIAQHESSNNYNARNSASKILNRVKLKL